MSRYTLKKLETQLQKSFVMITEDQGFNSPHIFSIVSRLNTEKGQPTKEELEALRNGLTDRGFRYVVSVLKIAL